MGGMEFGAPGPINPEGQNESPFAGPARAAMEAAEKEAAQAAGSITTGSSVRLETADDWAYSGWEDDGGSITPEN